jgi:hypothetical protein
MSLSSIQKEIGRLDSHERAKLLDWLWESLDPIHIRDLEAKWASESEKRINAFERNELSAVDGPSTLNDLRSTLTNDLQIYLCRLGRDEAGCPSLRRN